MSADYIPGSGFDTTFELNKFNEPRIRSELETLKNVVSFILFSKPGNYPSIPQIGMDIERYLFSSFDEIDENKLKSQLIEQCSFLGTYINSRSVDIKKLIYRGKPSLIIHIEGSEVFPNGYKNDKLTNTSKYLIGLTYDELNKLIHTENSQ